MKSIECFLHKFSKFLEPFEVDYFQTHKERFIHTIELINFCIKETFGKRKNLRVLDLGSHIGIFSLFLKKLGYNVYAIEKERIETKHWIERYRKLGIKYKIYNLERVRIPFPNNYFDIILMLEVIEHITVLPQIIFKEIYKKLRNNGVLFLTTPNLLRIQNRLKFLIGQCPFPIWKYDQKEGMEHFREYSFKELKSVLEEIGFEIYFSEFFGGKGKPTLNPLRILLKICRYAIPTFRNDIFICAKKV